METIIFKNGFLIDGKTEVRVERLNGVERVPDGDKQKMSEEEGTSAS